MAIDGSKPFTNNDGSTGTIYPNSGGSHVTTHSGGNSHITTEVGGMKQGGAVKVHIPVSDSGKVGPSSFD